MKYSELKELIENTKNPVVLIEGKRNIPDEYYFKALKVAELLASQFLDLKFRSGNADGADEAFSLGVKNIDPERLQIFAPYIGHKKKVCIPGAEYVYPENLSNIAESEIVYHAIKASPKYKSLIENRNMNSSLKAKANYLIRDTMKAVYQTEILSKPMAALFYVDNDDIDSGGTGHTIRVCRNMNIPVILQDSWELWV